MKLSTASAILCTALLASFSTGNAFPYPDYRDLEAFLQQKEHLGTDVAAWIEQDSRGELQSCPDFLRVLNAANTKDIRESRDIHNGIIISANFTYACASPFILFVSHDGELTYQRSQTPSILYECRENSGTYQPSIDEKGFPRCFSLCPELSISNGDVEYDVDRPREPHTEATYRCREGYTLEGERTRICGQEGKWLGEDPECIEVMCPELSDIPNGTVTVTNRRPRGIATYSCLEDYYLSGEQTRTCRQDGKWSCKEPTCFPLCPILSLQFGHIMYIFGDRKHGDIAAYSCRYGYRLVGPKERTCRQDGKWSEEEPVCEAIICPLVNPMPNGDRRPSSPPITLSDGRVGFSVDTVITYTCRPNFELQGESTRTCLESGEWDRPEPFCAHVCVPKRDIYFVVDSTDSVGDDIFCRFGYVLQLITAAVNPQGGNSDGARMAAILFEFQPYTTASTLFGLGELCSDIVSTNIPRVVYEYYAIGQNPPKLTRPQLQYPNVRATSTQPYSALDLTADSAETVTGRPSSVVIMTDGKSHQDVTRVINRLKKTSDPLISAGIGLDTDTAYLETLASNSSTVVYEQYRNETLRFGRRIIEVMRDTSALCADEAERILAALDATQKTDIQKYCRSCLWTANRDPAKCDGLMPKCGAQNLMMQSFVDSKSNNAFSAEWEKLLLEGEIAKAVKNVIAKING